MCQGPVPELSTVITGDLIEFFLLANTAAAMGERQILPKQTIVMLI
jgi:hypothetical protein